MTIVYPELTPAGPQRWTLTVDGTEGEVVMRDGFYGAFIGDRWIGTFSRPGPAGLAIQQDVQDRIAAVQLVLADQRESWTPEEMTDQECLEHVYNTLLVRDIFGDDPTAQAYRRLLTERWGATA